MISALFLLRNSKLCQDVAFLAPVRLKDSCLVRIYKKRLLLRYKDHFYIGFNQQYGPYAHFGYWTLISDPQPHKISSKVGQWCPKSAKTSWSEKGCCNKLTESQVHSFLTRNFFMFLKCYALPEVDHRTWFQCKCVLGDSLVHRQWHSTRSWNIKRNCYKDIYSISKSDLINNIDHMRISGSEW